jgi:hypothetical protein
VTSKLHAVDEEINLTPWNKLCAGIQLCHKIAFHCYFGGIFIYLREFHASRIRIILFFWLFACENLVQYPGSNHVTVFSKINSSQGSSRIIKIRIKTCLC